MRFVISAFALVFLLVEPSVIAQSASQRAEGNAVTRTPDRGGIEILSDTHGVDLSSWLMQWHRETERNWKPPTRSEVHVTDSKKSKAVIRFKVLPNGRLKDGSMVLESPTGITAFDRAAWFALVHSKYAPLPNDFHDPYMEFRAYFVYDTESQH